MNDLLPECPEYDRPPCRASIEHSCWRECTALYDTNFGTRHCPFYKTAETFEAEYERTIYGEPVYIPKKPAKLIIKEGRKNV